MARPRVFRFAVAVLAGFVAMDAMCVLDAWAAQPWARADASAAADSCLVPLRLRGDYKWEARGSHDAANIRTAFWNFGMVGDFFARDPVNVDLTTFHSAEVPKGSGMNYSDGISPFVLAKVRTEGRDVFIMETGFRERQAISASRPGELQMRFEPRPGYFQDSVEVNPLLSPAISSDPLTWPATWPDKASDASDPGWKGSWNGYFGKRPAADQESYFVMDDDYYDSFGFSPDSNCASADSGRRGLGLRVECRGFQWANPQAGNVIFWHYDITNESTTDYNDNIIFGLYMDSGVGGSAVSCDGVPESDDDNAFFDKSLGLNLVYTWDRYGHGVDLAGGCSPSGYLGYAYLETPGNPYDSTSSGVPRDNDDDGISNERRDGGRGEKILGQDAIRTYVTSHYDLAKFEKFFGPLEKRPAYKLSVWWTGDEDMDWIEEFDDTGGDGIFGSPNPIADGERDGIPTEGETHFDRTDVDESDQIGLTGFKMNRIKAGTGSPSNQIDDIVFFTNQYAWPERLYNMFANADSSQRFDQALVLNYNIGFLFASGPFRLPAGKRERFSLALAYGADLAELRENVHVVQQIYNSNYQFEVAPPRPTLDIEAGDGRVTLTWDDVAERAFDPVSGQNDFEGYRIYRSTDPEFRDPRLLTNGRGNPLPGNGKPIAQFDLADGIRGYSSTAVGGVQYWLGSETGITHTWTDTTVQNGQTYYYAVCAYDYGSPLGVPDSLSFYPSENTIPVSRNARGELSPVISVKAARPEPRVPGFSAAGAADLERRSGTGSGSVRVDVVNNQRVPDGHVFRIAFLAPSPDSIHAFTYALIDSTTGDTLFARGEAFDGLPAGPSGAGLLPVVNTPAAVLVDTTHFHGGPARVAIRPFTFSPKARAPYSLTARYVGSKSPNLRRPGYPQDLRIVFYDEVADTSTRLQPFPALPVKFRVFALTDTGYRQIDFTFQDFTNATTPPDSTLASPLDQLSLFDYSAPLPRFSDYTYQVGIVGTVRRPPAARDTFDIHLQVPFGPSDAFAFRTRGAAIDAAQARADFAQSPYVVPNPYVGSASFEPARFAVSGRGERLMEFRAIPQSATVRIYTVHGDLVRTLQQDGSHSGYVPWDLRTKDNLDVAPGLYVFQVSAPGVGDHVGKFAIIK